MRNRMFKRGLGLGLMLAGMIFLVNISWAKNGNSAELEKEKCINFLPKDKFVFIEIREENEGQGIRHFGDAVNPRLTMEERIPPPSYGYKLYNNNNKLLTIEFRKRRGGSAFWIEEFPKPEIGNTVAIIGYTLNLYSSKGGGAGTREVTFIETLPSLLRLSETSEEYFARAHKIHTNWTEGPSEPLVRWPSINLIKIEKDGSIVIRCENKETSLRPGENWEDERKVRTGFLKLKLVKLSIEVKNHGIFDKDTEIKFIEPELPLLR